MLIRAQPADFGWELHEFDPFFNYRATEYIVENGIEKYFQWHDDLSWYPHGRNISQSSQVMLHVTAAVTYDIFGGGMDLYDYTILFPAIIGSLTCIVIFALVRIIGGTTAGLFAALFFSISLPIIIRGQIAWFKSEPLGLFFSIFAVYLFFSGLHSKNQKNSFIKLIFAGIFVIFGISAWGGTQFFLLPFGIFFLTLPFLKSDHKFLLYSIPIFTVSAMVTSFAFERLSTNFIVSMGGFALILPTIFLICCIFLQSKSKPEHKTRNGLIFLTAVLIATSGVFVLSISLESFPLPSHRYLNAIYPFLTTTNPLIDSVAEHATTTIEQSFLFHTILMLFAGIGIWLLLKNSKKYNFIKNDMIAYSLILGLFGVYISSAFLRLEVFASLSLVVLSSLGLTILVHEFFSNKKQSMKFQNTIINVSFVIGVVTLLIIPLSFPEHATVFALTDSPPTILNGGTNFRMTTTDWADSLEWIKNNTPENSVIGSWWDYGYWIQTKAERASIADNSTLNDHIIEKIAHILLSKPDQSWKQLEEMDVDYFMIFVAAEQLGLTGNGNQPLYLLGGGGDESKKPWFMRIANEPLSKYVHNDGMSGTDYFWNDTLLGKMIPFEVLGYVNLQTQQQSQSYQPGFGAIYEKNIKFPKDGNGPFKLVYSSSSFNDEQPGKVIGVFVYEVNKDYVPLN